MVAQVHQGYRQSRTMSQNSARVFMLLGKRFCGHSGLLCGRAKNSVMMNSRGYKIWIRHSLCAYVASELVFGNSYFACQSFSTMTPVAACAALPMIVFVQREAFDSFAPAFRKPSFTIAESGIGVIFDTAYSGQV